jgi:hypothetical protein
LIGCPRKITEPIFFDYPVVVSGVSPSALQQGGVLRITFSVLDVPPTELIVTVGGEQASFIRSTTESEATVLEYKTRLQKPGVQKVVVGLKDGSRAIKAGVDISRALTAINTREVNTEPSLDCLGLVRVVEGPAGAKKAVIGAEGYLRMVGADDVIGFESAKVTAVNKGSITVATPSGDITKILKSERLKSVPCDGDVVARDTPVAADPVPSNPALEPRFRWRSQVIRGITRGYGIPVEMAYAVILSQSTHSEAATVNALRSLGWAPSADIERAWLNRLEYRQGEMTVDGHAPNRETVDSIVSRLKSANPIISDVKRTSEKPDKGVAYTLKVKGPAISLRDIVMQDVKDGTDTWPDEMRQKLDAAAQSLPRNNALGGFAADLKGVAAQVGVTITRAERQANSIEEGYLGVVSYQVEGAGDTKAFMDLLITLQTKGVTGKRVVIDPMVLNGTSLTATLRVPYIVGKVGGRTPIPSLILARKQSNRWKPALELTMDKVRDPFGAPAAQALPE